jgi:hypothetical protein
MRGALASFALEGNNGIKIPANARPRNAMGIFFIFWSMREKVSLQDLTLRFLRFRHCKT